MKKTKKNRDHEIGTQKQCRNNFVPHRDLNHIPLKPKASATNELC